MLQCRAFLSVIFCVLFFALTAEAQHSTRSGFRSPLDIPLNLSGNFGEFRSNHFHTGLDIKTQGRTGLPIYAIAEGHISRIKISSYGYGTVIYVDHPNGYTSVYAHLSKLNDKIENFLRDAQYELESWEVDLYPGVGLIPIDSSEVIAWSGNSGSSGGPHLHFEIRETDSEFPVNPLLWDFPVADSRAPALRGIQVVPLEDSSQVMGTHRSQLIATNGTSGKVSLTRKGPIPVYGPVGVGVHTIDQLDNNSNICGIFRLEVFLDDELLFEEKLEQLDFATNRFMNAHMDFATMKQEKKSIHRTFRLPYNRLPIYRTVKNNGRIELPDNQIHSVLVKVYDVHGNTSEVSFDLQQVDEPNASAESGSLKPSGARRCAFDKVNTIRTEGCNLFIPEGRLYDDAYVWINEVRGGPLSVKSPYFEVGNRFEPVHEEMILKIDAEDVPDSLVDKLMILQYNPGKKRYYNRGGSYKLGWVNARVKAFGTYVVGMDTVPPVIKTRKATRKELSFTITDDLSGIDHWEARVDGKWIRMHFDHKKARLWYKAEDGMIDEESKYLLLRVWDERGNVAEIGISF
ncbi:MAG: M23 family metallopeptidase [Flavobacteriales bacterium]|nr:M23 family metallopeptidase [Flavobacteriales bacterium]